MQEKNNELFLNALYVLTRLALDPISISFFFAVTKCKNALQNTTFAIILSPYSALACSREMWQAFHVNGLSGFRWYRSCFIGAVSWHRTCEFTNMILERFQFFVFPTFSNVTQYLWSYNKLKKVPEKTGTFLQLLFSCFDFIFHFCTFYYQSPWKESKYEHFSS